MSTSIRALEGIDIVSVSMFIQLLLKDVQVVPVVQMLREVACNWLNPLSYRSAEEANMSFILFFDGTCTRHTTYAETVILEL